MPIYLYWKWKSDAKKLAKNWYFLLVPLNYSLCPSHICSHTLLVNKNQAVGKAPGHRQVFWTSCCSSVLWLCCNFNWRGVGQAIPHINVSWHLQATPRWPVDAPQMPQGALWMLFTNEAPAKHLQLSIFRASAGHVQAIWGCPADASSEIQTVFPEKISWTSTGHLQGIWGWPADTSPRNLNCISWKNQPNIYRVSTGHLGVACRCLSKKYSLKKLANAPKIITLE